MSEELKKKDMNVSRATIVQRGDELTYGGCLLLMYEGKTVARVRIDPKGLQAAPDHYVKAWIETDLEVMSETPNTGG
jgi:hypothetical protein